MIRRKVRHFVSAFSDRVVFKPISWTGGICLEFYLEQVLLICMKLGAELLNILTAGMVCFDSKD